VSVVALEKFESLTAEEQARLAPELIRQAYLNDFFLYSKYLLGYKDMNWETHGETIEAFESDSKRKVIVLPRGTFKSSIGCVAYPMWRLEHNPDLTVLIDSELYTNSKNFIREIKGHYESEKYKNVFGDRIGDKWGESEIVVKHRRKNVKEASCTAGGIFTQKTGQHYSLIIGDDYNSNKNSDSPEKCQKVIDHVRYNLNILNPGGEYVFIGTRYSERDVIGWILKDSLNEPHLADGKMILSLME